MITTGVTGHEWRASITPWGSIRPWGEGPSLDWYVAADDRWHTPEHESAVRQSRLEGTAVTETRVRVPNGDVVQRIYSVANAGGLTIVEVENESTLPVAVAFGHRELLTERPIAGIPIEGIDLPESAFVMPLAHSATIRVAIPHTGDVAGLLAPELPGALQVVRGWQAITERASRLLLPDGELGSTAVERATAQRCELALGTFPSADDDPAGFAIALGELVRMGERPDPWLPELVEAVEAIGPVDGWDGDVALDAAGRVLASAGERRAERDLAAIRARRSPAPEPFEPPSDVRLIPWLERRLAQGGALLPAGFPPGWLGQSLDVYGLPTLGASTVSYAIRWHGERPAVLWEQTGDPIALTSPVAPEWVTEEATGETLWPVPPSVDAPSTRESSTDESPSEGSSTAGSSIDERSSGSSPVADDEPGSFS